ncbi:MAG: GNAT family N-acetyltransferase [Candidatus Izemoplasmatales bacterium]|jgi:GNAT superfamily N-acetyltransferase|nr:GNAT family N-acetyltransferase [Candidatus Izemoplasmatales bacterium]MDD4988775.1 GNAT family N-acetyltransferase [Candidatus Izemoplasmatales bacterium]MDD5602092.1 GNAT family N-acetyltransferase [Candidatus Izemoplasmatales bacterium]
MMLKKENVIIRKARSDEGAIILSFIRKIAVYERLSDQVEATEAKLTEALFIHQDAHVIFAVHDDVPIAFALYYFHFSTFKGKKGLYLEDLYVDEPYRHQGIGRQLFQYLIQLAKKEKCGRMEWTCLDWNRPAIDFYRQLGAEPLSEWTTFRLDEKTLERL